MSARASGIVEEDVNTQQLREAGVALWGRQIWHVKLASKIKGIKPHHIGMMANGQMEISDDVKHVLTEGLRKRAITCIEILRETGASL